MQYARVVIDVRLIIFHFHKTFLYLLLNSNNTILQCATANPDGKSRALVIGGGIANFTDVAATFNGIIRALKEKVKLELLLDSFVTKGIKRKTSWLTVIIFLNRKQS